MVAGTPTILRAMGISEQRWVEQVRGTETIYWRAIGSADSLCRRAEDWSNYGRAAYAPSWTSTGLGRGEIVLIFPIRLRWTSSNGY